MATHENILTAKITQTTVFKLAHILYNMISTGKTLSQGSSLHLASLWSPYSNAICLYKTVNFSIFFVNSLSELPHQHCNRPRSTH